MPATKGDRKWSRKGVPAQKGGGVPVQEGSRKGLGRGPGRGVPVQEGGGSCAGRGFLGGSWDGSCAGRGGGFLCRMGVPGGFLGWFLCRKGGGGSCAGWGFLGGSWDSSCAGRVLCHLGVANDRPGGHQQARVHGSGLGWCHLHPVHQNVTALLGTPGESSKAAVHHHQNAPRRRNQQGVVFRSRPGQPLALVCMPRQWAVLRLGGCVSRNHMWCGRCLVMPGVKRRPIRWNQTGHHVLHGRDTTRISGLGTPRIGCCCCYCFSVALAALDPRVIAAKDLDSTPKALLTCRLPAASVDSTTDSGLVTTKPRDIRQLASECSQIMAGVYYVVTLAT